MWRTPWSTLPVSGREAEAIPDAMILCAESSLEVRVERIGQPHDLAALGSKT
jgi:hypothetical protein